MPQQRDIIVIGGSAGSLRVLRNIMGGLPADFPASIFVVIHVSPETPAILEDQLAQLCNLPVSYPLDGDPIRASHVYLARPDCHLLIEDGNMRVLRGPRENRHRPAIDPLFRTAARTYGARVIGLILSGIHDDGSAGLYAVKQRGGVGIVLDPLDAAYGEMPSRALAYARPQYMLRAEEIALNLVKLVNPKPDETPMPNNKQKTASGTASNEVDKPDENLKASYSEEGEGTPSVFACPECHGVLWEINDSGRVRFRCRVGHSFGQDSLATELSGGAEAALWAAMRALEEKSAMQRRMADALDKDHKTAQRLREQSKADDAHARMIREMIFREDDFQGDASGSKKIA